MSYISVVAVVVYIISFASGPGKFIIFPTNTWAATLETYLRIHASSEYIYKLQSQEQIGEAIRGPIKTPIFLQADSTLVSLYIKAVSTIKRLQIVFK